MGLFEKLFGKPKEVDTESRRKFLWGLSFVSASLFLGVSALQEKGGVSDELKEESQFKKEYIENAPELLQAYAKQFKNWEELTNSQVEVAKEIINSSVYKKALERKVENFFSGKFFKQKKNSWTVETVVNELIRLRLKNIEEIKVLYKNLRDEKVLGKYFHKIMYIDTLANSTNSLDEGSDFENNSINMFVALHELTHAMNDSEYGLSYFEDIIYILDILEKIIL